VKGAKGDSVAGHGNGSPGKKPVSRVSGRRRRLSSKLKTDTAAGDSCEFAVHQDGGGAGGSGSGAASPPALDERQMEHKSLANSLIALMEGHADVAMSGIGKKGISWVSCRGCFQVHWMCKGQRRSKYFHPSTQDEDGLKRALRKALLHRNDVWGSPGPTKSGMRLFAEAVRDDDPDGSEEAQDTPTPTPPENADEDNDNKSRMNEE